MPLLNRVVRIARQAYYQLSKTSLRELMDCMMKHFLLHKFKNQIPQNKYLALGSLLHRIIEYEFWGKNWHSPDSFADYCQGRWLKLFGHFERNKRDQLIIVFSVSDPRLDGSPIALREPEKDFWWGYQKIGRCAFNYARRFLGTPKPILEESFRFIYDGLLLTGKFDALFKRNEIVGPKPWYIGENKTGQEPLDTDWEPTVYIVAWGKKIQEPGFAQALGVTPGIVSEVAENPLAALKYCGVVYFMLDREDPERLEVYHHREIKHWFLEFSPAAHEQQERAFKAVGTGEILLNRNHCSRCEAKAVCDAYLKEKHGLVTKPESLFDPGVLLPSSRRRARIADIYRLDFDPRSKTHVRKLPGKGISEGGA